MILIASHKVFQLHMRIIRCKITCSLPCESDEYKENDGEGPPLTVSPDILMVLHHLPSTVTTATSTAAEAESDQGEDEEEQKTDHDTGSIPPKLLQVLQQKTKRYQS